MAELKDNNKRVCRKSCCAENMGNTSTLNFLRKRSGVSFFSPIPEIIIPHRHRIRFCIHNSFESIFIHADAAICKYRPAFLFFLLSPFKLICTQHIEKSTICCRLFAFLPSSFKSKIQLAK